MSELQDVTVKFGDLEIECDLSFEMHGTPYLGATWDYPAEGGLDKVTDARIVVAYDIEDDEYGPTLDGMLLSKEQIEDLWYEFGEAFEKACEDARGEAMIEAYESSLAWR